ncbi:hypothetical protein [Tardiphaga sp. 862_B3_N1_1]|uniref:hypothetical protein n=1 Tax=Tardiphaga sp. 862_B3_N1_1 TaxID=3240763 RepID=UPI003F89BDB0
MLKGDAIAQLKRALRFAQLDEAQLQEKYGPARSRSTRAFNLKTIDALQVAITTMESSIRPMRIRVCECEHCRLSFKWRKRRPTDEDIAGIRLQVCPHCFHYQDGNRIFSSLENAADYEHLK